MVYVCICMYVFNVFQVSDKRQARQVGKYRIGEKEGKKRGWKEEMLKKKKEMKRNRRQKKIRS